MERSVDEPPLPNIERLVAAAQVAHENLHKAGASVRAEYPVAAKLLEQALPSIQKIIAAPATVRIAVGAKVLDCIYQAEYYVENKKLRNNVNDVIVRLCWRGTDPNDDVGMIRALENAFGREVQTEEPNMVSRLMHANRTLAGERPGQEGRRRRQPRPGRTQRSVSVPDAARAVDAVEGTDTPRPREQAGVIDANGSEDHIWVLAEPAISQDIGTEVRSSEVRVVDDSVGIYRLDGEDLRVFRLPASLVPTYVEERTSALKSRLGLDLGGGAVRRRRGCPLRVPP